MNQQRQPSTDAPANALAFGLPAADVAVVQPTAPLTPEGKLAVICEAGGTLYAIPTDPNDRAVHDLLCNPFGG